MDKDFEKNDWYAQSVEAKSDPLVDSGIGQAVIIRTFEFQANPELLKKIKPTKQEIFNNHAGQIRLFLWKDGLEPIDSVSPRIVISKKKDNYRIFVGCKPKPGVALVEKPLTLQELIKPNAGQSGQTGGNSK